MTTKNRFRALRNFAIAAVLVFALWIVNGAPLPAEELEMRRAEREHLAEYSKIVWRYESVDFWDQDVVTLVGLTPTQIHAYGSVLTVWARSCKEPTFVVLPHELPYPTEDGRDYAPALLAVDTPAGAVSARLELTLEIWKLGGIISQEIYEMEGRQEDGMFLFGLTRHYLDRDDLSFEQELNAFYDMRLDLRGTAGQYVRLPYTLEFFDGDGVLISTYTGQVGQ